MIIDNLDLSMAQCERVHFIAEDRFHDLVLKHIYPHAQKIITSDKRQLLFVDNGADVLGIAHLDGTLEPTHFFHGRGYHDGQYQIMSTMVDDRLGVFTLLNILPQLPDVKIDILLTVGEEQGNSTAQFFKPPRQYNWMFQFDRGGTDAVHYQYTKPMWLSALRKHFTGINHGMASDISLMGHLGCQGVNIGTAYYDYTSHRGWANLNQLVKQVRLFENFYRAYQHTPFLHDAKSAKFSRKRRGSWVQDWIESSPKWSPSEGNAL